MWFLAFFLQVRPYFDITHNQFRQSTASLGENTGQAMSSETFKPPIISVHSELNGADESCDTNMENVWIRLNQMTMNKSLLSPYYVICRYNVYIFVRVVLLKGHNKISSWGKQVIKMVHVLHNVYIYLYKWKVIKGFFIKSSYTLIVRERERERERESSFTF